MKNKADLRAKKMKEKQYRLGDQIITGYGCLQLEFSERLKKLPAWGITHYYCASANLRDVGTGQPLTHFFTTGQQGQTYAGLSRTCENGIFRLGRYKVSIEKTGSVSWQRYKRPDCIKGGRGFIKSGILFLGPGE